jgi:hypothetical protein
MYWLPGQALASVADQKLVLKPVAILKGLRGPEGPLFHSMQPLTATQTFVSFSASCKLVPFQFVKKLEFFSEFP